jgi:hypothetical protein
MDPRMRGRNASGMRSKRTLGASGRPQTQKSAAELGRDHRPDCAHRSDCARRPDWACHLEWARRLDRGGHLARTRYVARSRRDSSARHHAGARCDSQSAGHDAKTLIGVSA